MTGVDDGIVSMKFDNEAFERKLNETIRSLDKLRQSLDFTNASRGMENVASAAKHVDFTPVASSIDAISNKFLALSTVAITVLSNITTKALQAGTQMLSAFSFSPIQSGFQEFETNMNSIQTILSNTRADGTNLEQVNAALDQLNQYSDQTIYNFAQMARNIGTFTAAGVDLDTSVGAIKGIANLAAVSGSSAEQASNAMYQLSQALATGTLRLIDWNSVNAAGLGGEVFQKQLFATGQALGTLKSTHMGQTFEEWTAAGNTFRGSLEDNWITSDVLTAALQGFTGDMSEAQLLQMGYTQEQATEILALGADAKAAATEVKTFTQLLGTIKESIGSGWSATFRTVIGDFAESKELFTEINNAIGGMVGRSADARNELLGQWKFFGGRDDLIQSFRNLIRSAGEIITPLKEAFRDIFPPMTAVRLLEMTENFRAFTSSLRIGDETTAKLKSVFRGFFAVIEIGWEVVKNVFGLVKDIFNAFSGVGSGVLDFSADAGDALTNLNAALVEGGGIRDFFDKVSGYITTAIEKLMQFKDAVVDFFAGTPDEEGKAEEAIGRIGDRLGVLDSIIGKIGDAWDWLKDKMSGVTDTFEEINDYIANWFSELGDRIAASFTGDDFNESIDLLNAGLLGGIVAMLANFMRNGIDIDFGNGFFRGINEALNGLTDTLGAMQAQLRSRTLMNIAIAIGILAASVTVLSLIDSQALARALTAMAASFAELMAAMAVMESMNTTTSAAKITAMATAMILLAVAVGILSLAVTNLSQLDWGELGRGLAGVAASMAILTTSTRLIASDTSGLIRAGIAMGIIAVGIGLLSIAVKQFAEMSWEEMGQGLVGVSVGLAAITTAMNFMPTDMAGEGVALAIMAGGLLLLSSAVESFSDMSWAEMGQGLLGVAAGLTAITVAMNFMPTDMFGDGLAFTIIAGGLWLMSKAVESMGDIPLDEMAKGIGGLTIMLMSMAIAMNVMNGAAAGAASFGIMVVAMFGLVEVIKELGSMDVVKLAIGIGAIAAVLLVFAAAATLIAPVSPALLALAVSMTLVGASFALFGVGVFLVAKAFEALASAGRAGVDALVGTIMGLIQALPEMTGQILLSLSAMVADFIDALPLLIEAVTALIDQILATIEEEAPKFAHMMTTVISEFLTAAHTLYPQLQETGLLILMTLLRGLRENIDEIVTTASEIFILFNDALREQMPELVDSAAQLIIAFLEELANHAADISTAGLNLLAQFLLGISDNIGDIAVVVTLIITNMMQSFADSYLSILTMGVNILIMLLRGITDNIIRVADAVTAIITELMAAFTRDAQRIIDVGFYLLTQFLWGITGNLSAITTAVGTMIGQLITDVGDQATNIAKAGGDALIKFIEGIGANIKRVTKAAVEVVVGFINGIDNSIVSIADAGAQMLTDLLNGLTIAIKQNDREIQNAARGLAWAIIDGITLGLWSKAQDVFDAMENIARGAFEKAKEILLIDSPSKAFYELGGYVVEGFADGINANAGMAVNSAGDMAKSTIKSFEDTFKKIPFSMVGMDDLEPVITPVLDLTNIQNGSSLIERMLAVSELNAGVSINKAQLLSQATTADELEDEPGVTSGSGDVTYIQNINAPTAPSVNDVYRNTKSLIALSKEELKI